MGPPGLAGSEVRVLTSARLFYVLFISLYGVLWNGNIGLSYLMKGDAGLAGVVGDTGPKGEKVTCAHVIISKVTIKKSILYTLCTCCQYTEKYLKVVISIFYSQGDIGPRGFTGLEGPWGDVGEQGEKGQKGTKGHIGLQVSAHQHLGLFTSSTLIFICNKTVYRKPLIYK